MRKKKIAFINQRYGLEVNGGSEYYTRLMAEKLKERYDVEVLTTCAMDYVTWENVYPAGATEINGVTVRRFTNDRKRDMQRFGKVNAELVTLGSGPAELESRWIEEQGPVCSGLLHYIEANQDNYDVFVFVTYLYYLTVKGIQSVAEKAILIPTAHDEPYIKFNTYKNVFACPKGMIFLTDEEEAFVHKRFKNQQIPSDVIAVGVDVPDQIDAQSFIQKHRLDSYLIYVGRIDQSKGCDKLFEYFAEYKKRNAGELKLVLMGKPVMNIPRHKDILSLGFVSEEEKYNGIQGAKALILPSSFESLSISVLESMTLGVPVIVNGQCEVLKGHCVKSNAGLYYHNYFEFEGAVNYMLKHPEIYRQMGRNAKAYIEANYRWDVIIEKFGKMMDMVSDTHL